MYATLLLTQYHSTPTSRVNSNLQLMWHFIFISVLLSSKKLSTWRCSSSSLMNVGILLEFDGWLPCWLSNKHHHVGGAICHHSGMAVANQPALPLGASLEGVGWGRYTMVSFSLMIRPRNKIYSQRIYFSFLLLSTSTTSKTMVSCIPRSPVLLPGLTSYPFRSLPRMDVLGWLLSVKSWTGSYLRLQWNAFSINLSFESSTQTIGQHQSMHSTPRASPLSFG